MGSLYRSAHEPILVYTAVSAEAELTYAPSNAPLPLSG